MSFDHAQSAAETVTARERPHRVIEWPGDPSVSVALVILTRKEIEQALLAAAKYLRAELKVDPIDLSLVQADLFLEAEKEIQLLAAALRRPDCISVRAFETAALRDDVTSEEQIALMQAYNAYEKERSPLSKGDDPEKVLDEVIRLGKPEAQWTWAQYCEPGTLRDIAICAVKRLSLQTSENSSAT